LGQTERKLKFDSLAVHAGEKHDYGSVTTPIAQTSTFIFRDMAEAVAYGTGKVQHYEYGRYGNPTRETAQIKLAAIEGTEGCMLFDSGMRAVTCTIMGLVSMGQHVVLTDDVYKKTLQFAQNDLPRFGITATVVPMGNYEAMEKAIKPETRLLISESPTNPYLNIADMGRMAEIGRRHGLITIIDSTFGTPYNQRPIEYGIDLVIHSVTKYLGGHNDILGGALLGRKELLDKVTTYHKTTGGILDPHSCYLLIRGVKSLGVRMERHNASGLAVAQFLEKHPKVKRVYYPGLASHVHHELAARQMKGFGAVVTFKVDSDLHGTMRFLDSCKLCLLGPSLGGSESLIYHPALISYYAETPERRLELGITDDLVRLSCGLEDTEDIIADLDHALEVAF